MFAKRRENEKGQHPTNKTDDRPGGAGVARPGCRKQSC
jgi:hypothetical protein